jgi:uncharacterized protein
LKLEGEVTLRAPRERVWAVLNDPAVMQRHMPGCECLNEVEPDCYEAVLKIGVAAIKGTYKATLHLEDKQPPASYRMAVEGAGKPGFVKGTGSVTLHEQDGGTRVVYSGDLQVGGLIARVGMRLLGGITDSMTREFFNGLCSEVTQDGEACEDEPGDPPAA